MLTGLHHIGVHTADIEKSIAFYEKLGFETYYRKEMGPTTIVFTRVGSCVVELIQPGDKDSVAQRGAGLVDHIAIAVTDIDATVKDLQAKGIAFDADAPSHSDGMFANGMANIFLTGPSGERLELFEEK